MQNLNSYTNPPLYMEVAKTEILKITPPAAEKPYDQSSDKPDSLIDVTRVKTEQALRWESMGPSGYGC